MKKKGKQGIKNPVKITALPPENLDPRLAKDVLPILLSNFDLKSLRGSKRKQSN